MSVTCRPTSGSRGSRPERSSASPAPGPAHCALSTTPWPAPSAGYGRPASSSNTYVVFTSDNGFQIGEHRQKGKNLPFDESFDIPLVIRGPGIPAGERIGEPVTLVDLGATFLDWAGGVAPGRPLDGLPLREIGDRHPRDTILVQIGDSAADSPDGWKYRGVTTHRYLFVVHAGDPTVGLLFDRQRDPYATVNQFDRPPYASVRKELLRRTLALADCSGQAECNREFGALPKPA